uniref:Tgr2752C n=1 Tax=Dictyostelium purpureum TaxID=5786 RepID=A0A3S9KFY5_DICPU|nr:tgr2752C [Dictyostelium purpureum]
MIKIYFCILFIFFISKIYSNELVFYNRSYIEFNTNYPLTANFSLYDDLKCTNLKETYPFKCNSDKCVIELNETQIKNFYGNCILRCIDYDTDSYCKKQIDISNYMFPINYAISGLPSTEGSKLQLTGNFLRNWVNDYYIVEGSNDISALKFSVDKENFDPENLTVNFPPGYGSFTLYPDSSKKKSIIELKYAPPSISQCNYKDSTITLNGLNFYNNPSVAQVTINGKIASIVSIDHRLLKLNYATDLSQRLNINVAVGDTSLEKIYIFDIKPQPVSISTTVSTSKYNSGVITIAGNYMSSPQTEAQPNTNITLFSTNNKSYNCEHISSTATQIVCLLEPGEGFINKIKINIDDVESITDIDFKYGVAHFTSTSAIQTDRSNEFSITGINFGNINDTNGSVKLLLDGNENNDIIITSISNNESKLSFKLPKICETSLKLSIKVNDVISNNNITITPQPTFVLAPSRPLTNGSSLHIDKYFACKDIIVKPSITIDSSNNHIDCILISNTETSCNVGVGTGKHSFKFYVDGIEKIDSLFEYAPPTLVSHNVNGLKTVTLTGYNFGNDSSKCLLTFANNNVTCKVISDTTITFDSHSEYDFGNVNLIIDSIPMSNVNYKIMLPTIKGLVNNNNISTRNGTVCINGLRLPETKSANNNNANNVTIEIKSHLKDGTNTFKDYNVSNNMICVLLNDGYVGTFDLSVFIYNEFISKYTLSYNKPSFNNSSIDIKDGSNDTYQFEVYGNEFGKPFEIHFNTSKGDLIMNCTFDISIQHKNNDLYNCSYPKTNIDTIKDGNENLYLKIGESKYPINAPLNFENKETDNKSALKIGLCVALIGGATLCAAGLFGYIYRETIFKKIDKLKNGKSNV